MKKIWIVLIVAAVIILSLGGWFIKGLNTVVIFDENVKQAWAQVENQLQRRNDLIPNLLNTVKGYAAHEKGVFTKITELRSQWAKAQTTSQKIEASRGMTAALSKLLLVAENYPNLKANDNFLALQSQLEGTENRIAVERRRYNHAVLSFNAYKRTVFGSLFARLRDLVKPAAYFETEEIARQVPVVKF
ncbi:MAG: LemA family protein [Candidatus Omnitrophota bacterium]|nr:LemA family protein [Candidatus Omnitrophota bacterium]